MKRNETRRDGKRQAPFSFLFIDRRYHSSWAARGQIFTSIAWAFLFSFLGFNWMGWSVAFGILLLAALLLLLG